MSNRLPDTSDMMQLGNWAPLSTVTGTMTDYPGCELVGLVSMMEHRGGFSPRSGATRREQLLEADCDRYCSPDIFSSFAGLGTPNEAFARFLLPHSELVSIADAWKTISASGNKQVTKQARQFLLTFQEVVLQFLQFLAERNLVEPLHAAVREDTSAAIEWVFPSFRVGFSFEKNDEESSWQLVSLPNLGGIAAYGNLSSLNTRKLLLWLVWYVILYG